MQSAMARSMQAAMNIPMQAAMPAPVKATMVAQLNRHIAWILLKLSSQDLTTSGQGAQDHRAVFGQDCAEVRPVANSCMFW